MDGNQEYFQNFKEMLKASDNAKFNLSQIIDIIIVNREQKSKTFLRDSFVGERGDFLDSEEYIDDSEDSFLYCEDLIDVDKFIGMKHFDQKKYDFQHTITTRGRRAFATKLGDTFSEKENQDFQDEKAVRHYVWEKEEIERSLKKELFVIRCRSANMMSKGLSKENNDIVNIVSKEYGDSAATNFTAFYRSLDSALVSNNRYLEALTIKKNDIFLTTQTTTTAVAVATSAIAIASGIECTLRRGGRG